MEVDRRFKWCEVQFIFKPYIKKDSLRYCINKFVNLPQGTKRAFPYSKEHMILIYAYILFKKRKIRMKDYHAVQIRKFVRKNGYKNFKIRFNDVIAGTTEDMDKPFNKNRYKEIKIFSRKLFVAMKKSLGENE